MNIQEKLRKVAKEHDLKNNIKINYLSCTRREIILRNFLAGCPDPVYIKYRNLQKSNRPTAVLKFLNSKDFEKDLLKPQACLVTKEAIEIEIKLARRITNAKLKNELIKLYEKLLKKMTLSDRLILIDKNQNKEVLLHECIHELLFSNKIKFKSWKWSEGLATYLTYAALNKQKKLTKKLRPTKHKMWNIYSDYAHRWFKLLRKAKIASERRKIIKLKAI